MSNEKAEYKSGEYPIQAQTELIRDEVTLWQDHVNDVGYRAYLTLLTFENGEQCLELHSGGTVSRVKYVFPYSRKDRL